MAVPSDRFRRLVHESEQDRLSVRRLVADKRWREAEPDRDRMMRYQMRTAAMQQPRGAEAIQGEVIDFQAAWFLPAGAQIRRSVGYVEVTVGSKSEAGSGFLISPRLFLTNQHVIADEAAARGAQVTFDREMDDDGRPRPTTTFVIDPARFALFSKEEELDYAIVAIGERQAGAASLEELHYCVLSNRPDKHALGMNLNIIQHPRGLPKMIAIRNNILEYRTDQTLLYETDTDQGSSGSPVFSDNWELVALHHYGEPYLQKMDDQGRAIPTNVNEGVRISAIYDDLTKRLSGLPAEWQELLQEALSYSKQAGTTPAGCPA